MKNKTYLFLTIHGFQEQVLVVLIDIRINKKRIMKKIKDYLTKKCAGYGIRKKSHPRSRIKGGKKSAGTLILDPRHRLKGKIYR
jgi:hypothetical protein